MTSAQGKWWQQVTMLMAALVQLAHAYAGWFYIVKLRIISRVCQGPDLSPSSGVLWCALAHIPDTAVTAAHCLQPSSVQPSSSVLR
jgi:hypothetical protein